MNPMLEIVLPTIAGLLVVPIVLGICRSLGTFTTVRECESQVFTLFGKVIGTIDDPGLKSPLMRFGPQALLVPFFGKRHVV